MEIRNKIMKKKNSTRINLKKYLNNNKHLLGGALFLRSRHGVVPLPTLRHHWAGPRRDGLPAVGHFRWARVSFDSAFKLNRRTSAAATFNAAL